MSGVGLGTGSAMDAKLELLEVEAQAAVDHVHSMVSLAKAPQDVPNVDHVLASIDPLREECNRIRMLAVAMTSPTAAHNFEWAALEAVAPTAAALARSEDTLEQLGKAELVLWSQRINASREVMALMKETSAHELRQLEEEEVRSKTFQSVSLLAPAIPTLPGSASTTGLSLQQCLRELAEEEMRVATSGDALASSSFEAESVSVRALRTLDAQLQLQIDCRRLEPKLLENEDTTIVASLQQHSILSSVVVDRTTKLATTIEDIAFARAKMGAQLSLLPHPKTYPASDALRAACTKEMTSRNAQEGFQGYVKGTVNRMALLRGAAGIEFTLVPGGVAYPLGSPDPLQRFSVYPPSGSVDHEARLDRRTMYWLMSGASKKKSGLEYHDGPQHFIYSSKQRNPRLHAYHVMTQPLTIGQLHRLMSDRRFGAQLEASVPPMYRSGLLKPSFMPVFLNRSIARFRVDEVKRGPTEDEPVEVPYFVAEAIAAVLGGVVCPFDVWEAGGRGVEADSRQAFLYSEKEANQLLKVTRKGWCCHVDEDDDDGVVPREVYGESVRLRDASILILDNIATPFRLGGYARLGMEWNSVLRVDQGAQIERQAPSDEWVHTQTPMQLSILQSGDDDASDSDPATLTQSFAALDASAAASSQWAPDSCQFTPTSHVLRSLTDYGSQHIFGGATSTELRDGCTFEHDDTFDPQNEKSFIGTALYTFGLPNCGVGGPCAAFRVAFPAYSDGYDALVAAQAARDVVCGVDMTLMHLLTSLGKQQRHCSQFQALLFSDCVQDPLYGTRHFQFPAAGFDIVFASEIPNPVCQIDMYGAHALCRPAVVERHSFRHPIATDHTVPVTLPIEGQAWCRYRDSVVEALSKDAVVVDNDMELAFVDTIALPPPDPSTRHRATQPQPLRVHVSWTVSTLLNELFENVRVATRCTVKLAFAE